MQEQSLRAKNNTQSNTKYEGENARKNMKWYVSQDKCLGWKY